MGAASEWLAAAERDAGGEEKATTSPQETNSSPRRKSPMPPPKDSPEMVALDDQLSPKGELPGFTIVPGGPLARAPSFPRRPAARAAF